MTEFAMESRAEQLAADLAMFSGSENFYRHPLLRSAVYTDGVRYLAEQAGAYWLIDAIMSHQLRPHVRRAPFQVWRLRVRETDGRRWAWLEAGEDVDERGRMLVGDGGGWAVGRLVRQRIPFTDFPMPELVLYFENRTICLPGER